MAGNRTVRALISIILSLSLFASLCGCTEGKETSPQSETDPVTYNLVDKTLALEELADSMGDDIKFKVNQDGTVAFCMVRDGSEVPINEFSTVGKAYEYCMSTGLLTVSENAQ